MMNEKPLILLFAFNRLDCLKETVNSLLNNSGVENFEIIFFCDGPRKSEERPKTDSVRAYLKGVQGFKKITIYESGENKGLGNSVIEGVTLGLKVRDRVIVLEDDLVTSDDFLSFMDEGLTKYKSNTKVYSISGFLPKTVRSSSGECCFVPRISSLGWGIWKDRWQRNQWDFDGYEALIRNRASKKQFSRAGRDMLYMLINQAEGKANSWAIRCDFNRFKQNDSLTLYPATSKVSHIGNDGSGTNVSRGEDKFYYDDLSSGVYKFTDKVMENEKVNEQFCDFYGFSIKSIFAVHLRRLGVLECLKKLHL